MNGSQTHKKRASALQNDVADIAPTCVLFPISDARRPNLERSFNIRSIARGVRAKKGLTFEKAAQSKSKSVDCKQNTTCDAVQYRNIFVRGSSSSSSSLCNKYQQYANWLIVIEASGQLLPGNVFECLCCLCCSSINDTDDHEGKTERAELYMHKM